MQPKNEALTCTDMASNLNSSPASLTLRGGRPCTCPPAGRRGRRLGLHPPSRRPWSSAEADKYFDGIKRGIALFLAFSMSFPLPGYSARQISTDNTGIAADHGQELLKAQLAGRRDHAGQPVGVGGWIGDWNYGLTRFAGSAVSKLQPVRAEVRSAQRVL